MDWVAIRLAATLDAQSFSSYGGVGHFEGASSFTGRFFDMFNGLVGVKAGVEPNLTSLRFADGEGVR